MKVTSVCVLRDAGLVRLEHSSVKEAMKTCKHSYRMGVLSPPRVYQGERVFELVRLGVTKYKLREAAKE